MTSVNDEHRESYGVESTCAMLPIAPSPDCEQKALHTDLYSSHEASGETGAVQEGRCS